MCKHAQDSCMQCYQVLTESAGFTTGDVSERCNQLYGTRYPGYWGRQLQALADMGYAQKSGCWSKNAPVWVAVKPDEARHWRRAQWEPLHGNGHSTKSNDARSAELFWREPDMMHSLLIERADALAGCAAGTEEEAELERLTLAIEAYEAKRRPSGRTLGGKG